MIKKIIITIIISYASLAAVYAQELNSAPRIVIMDIMSNSLSGNDTKMFTDVLRTELYKIDYFSIVERGVIQQYLIEDGITNVKDLEDSSLLTLGKKMDVEKLLVCTMNSYDKTTVLNIRIIDVVSSNLDFTENIFLQDNNQIFDAIQDLVLKIELYYIEKYQNGDPVTAKDKLYKTWMRLGADDKTARKLTNIKVAPSIYLEMRQYDILFTTYDYYDVIKAGYEINNMNTFFKEGISYYQIKKAFSLGIVDLENYKNNFKPEDYTFLEYIDAYEHNILSPEDYAEYKKGFKKFEFLLGLGGVANDIPIANADTKFFLIQAAAEYYITDYQRGLSKASTEMGIYLMNAYIPSPYVQANAYIGKFPFYLKTSVGVSAEVFLAGHFGVFAKIGLEVNSLFEFNIMTTFAGSQPKVSYTDFETKEGEEGYLGISFPYMAAIFTYKF